MCQIFVGPSNDVKALLLGTAGLIESLYEYNPDGIGAMHASDGALHITKALPRDERQTRDFIATLPGGDTDVALHFRMRTRGDIDHDNCHPYHVIDGVALIHDGVLHHGNAADPRRSDTWHYARRLAVQLQHAPGLMHEAEWRRLVEADIGSNNRFVLMDGQGTAHILNRDTGYEKGSVWVANTYSFDAGLLWPERAEVRGMWGYSTPQYWPQSEDDDMAGLDYDTVIAGEVEYTIANNEPEDLAALMAEEGVLETLEVMERCGTWHPHGRADTDAATTFITHAVESGSWHNLASVDPLDVARVLVAGTYRLTPSVEAALSLID